MTIKQILSPLPGIFYRTPTPDEPNYKNEGDAVAVGDVIGLIEVMKSFHEIKSEFNGSLSSFHIDNEDAVMAGQLVAEIEE